ncbi:TPA: hypothetical protein ACSP5K_003870, partial [Aeromonas veronii]
MDFFARGLQQSEERFAEIVLAKRRRRGYQRQNGKTFTIQELSTMTQPVPEMMTLLLEIGEQSSQLW